MKLMKIYFLDIRSLIGAHLQLCMSPPLLVMPVFGDWPNLFSRNPCSLSSHFGLSFKHCSNILASRSD